MDAIAPADGRVVAKEAALIDEGGSVARMLGGGALPQDIGGGFVAQGGEEGLKLGTVILVEVLIGVTLLHDALLAFWPFMKPCQENTIYQLTSDRVLGICQQIIYVSSCR